MNIYRENILDHHRNPRNYGRLKSPSVSVDETNPLCGDHLHFDLAIEGGTLNDIKFEGGGCAISLAGASMLTEEVKARALSAVEDMTDKDMLALLGVPLSPTRTKCGLLAISGLRKALVSKPLAR